MVINDIGVADVTGRLRVTVKKKKRKGVLIREGQCEKAPKCEES